MNSYENMDANSLPEKKALVDVIVGYGNECFLGAACKHGRRVFIDLQKELTRQYSMEEINVIDNPESAYNIFYVYVNNEIVFACQGRRPPIGLVSQAIQEALAGKRPQRILFSQGIPFEYDSECKTHKYRC